MALSVIGCSVALASPGLLEMLASAVNELVSSAAEALRRPEVKTRVKAEEKEKVSPASPQSIGTTYYHVTTPDNAASIMVTGVMIGSKWEGGYVYAWRTEPNQYAILNSGAHTGVTISFKTNAPFTNDTGITDPLVQVYGPVVSMFPGPIDVWDVQIMG